MPHRKPRSFKFGSARDGDDRPVTVIKWIVAALFLVWLILIAIHLGK